MGNSAGGRSRSARAPSAPEDHHVGLLVFVDDADALCAGRTDPLSVNSRGTRA
jgi:hypothetical protein